MFSLKTAVLLALVLLASAKEENNNRGKRQQIAYYPKRGARPPPYAVQMEPIVQYSQRDPLYNPLASSKSDDRIYHDDPTLYNHYVTEPEPIIEIIIKESNESLPTPVPPPVPPQPRPTKEPIQVFYVKYEKKKSYGDGKSRVVYDAPVPALTPVEEHEEIQPEKTDEDDEGPALHAPVARLPEPSTTLRTIIHPESEVYHSGSSGIRVTFGTDQVPPNNHNKRSDAAATSSKAPPLGTSVTALPPPGSPKRQHGPYHPFQPVHSRVPPAFPQQRIVNSFPPQQLPQNYPGHQQFQPPPNGPINSPRLHQQRHPITVQGLPEIQQRLPFQAHGPPHRISINHPQQPGFPPAVSFSHQSVHLQNQPPSLVPAGNFNGDSHQQSPHQQQQAEIRYKQQEQEKQRYHQEQRRQQEVRHREQQKQQEQQRLAEQQRQQDQQRKLEQQRIVEQQRQVDQQRQQERQRQEEQLRIREQQQRFHLEQQQRKEQENKLLQEQQYRQQLKFSQSQPALNERYNQQVEQPIQQQKPGGEIFKAVPKLEQHYAIRENPLHPGPFPPNPQVQSLQYSESGQNQFLQQASEPAADVKQQHQPPHQQQHSLPLPPHPLQQEEQLQQQQDQQQQYFSRNPTTSIATTKQQHQQQQDEQLQQQQDQQQQYFSRNPTTSFATTKQQHQQQQEEQLQQQDQQQQYFSRNPTTSFATTKQQHQQQQHLQQHSSIATTQQQQQQQQEHQQQLQQHNTIANQQNYQSNEQFFSHNLPAPQQQRVPSSPQQSIWGRPVFQDNGKQKIYATPISTSRDLGPTSTARTIHTSPSGTTPAPTTTTPTPSTDPTTAAPKNEARIKENIANLPDEVPDDIREQLLSSGILGNADIQILDYDKVGGIPIENLPPEALANFYGAGGAAAAASEPVPAVAKRPKTVGNSGSSGQFPKKATFTKVERATLRPGGVEMKVVHFDPNTAQGQAIADRHIREDATHLQPVAVGARPDPRYNRYLPLKVSGASFPIPDVPELQGRKISSVVVLAPVDYSGFRDDDDDRSEDDDSRRGRMLAGAQPVTFLAGESLKQLVKKPSAENYKKWLDQESRTEPQKQSVVLLVTTPDDDSHGDKEIFMYDVSSRMVSKLSGDLSSAFVNAAESNSDSSDSIDDSAFTTD